MCVPPRGKCCPFFSFCVFFSVRSGVFCRFLSFFSSKGRFLEKFSGANFCFWMVVLVLCFLVGFCLCFCFIFGGSLPKLSGKILLLSGLVFFGVALFWFFRRRRFSRFFFKRQRSGSHRTPLHTHLFCCSLCLFLCPAAFVCFARFGRASRFSAFFSGCHSGPRAFLGFSLN